MRLSKENGTTFSDQTAPTNRNSSCHFLSFPNSLIRAKNQFVKNGTANFDRNIPTEISGPPPEVITNIPVGRNRNGPFHLNSERNFRNLWHNGKHPKILTAACTAGANTVCKLKADRLQMIVVAKKNISMLQLFISRMPKMCAILQLVSAPLNPKNYLLLQAKRKIKPRAGQGDQNKLTCLESGIQSKTSGYRLLVMSFSKDFVKKKKCGGCELVFVVLFRHNQSPGVGSDSIPALWWFPEERRCLLVLRHNISTARIESNTT